MAVTNGEAIKVQDMVPQGLAGNPVVRQLGVMIGIAASVALGVAIVLWSQTPSYTPLYGSLSQKDAVDVADALQKADIEFKVDEGTGAVMVPTGTLHEARMKLAGQGLPRGDSLGFELLQEDSGFGTSRTVEAARFQRALEGELARTVTTLANVESARVHLAVPKQSVFVRKRKHPSASVTVRLYAGRTLERGQVESIVHLVASSVPELLPERVTVVDHKGRLLSGDRDSRQMMLTSSQFEYTRDVEKLYKQRIEDILAPILGTDSVRAEVTAEMDFTVTEQTQERFNPDLPALRSEQINEQLSRLSAVQGVPGALSNQPPAAGTAPERVAGGVGATGGPAEPLNSSKRSIRNFEIDKTISHTQLASGNLRRLSVAVVIDDKIIDGPKGKSERVERTPEEISRITNLVREAIGFNEVRGDSVQVINSAFHVPAPPEPLPEPALWEQAWVWDLAKQIGGVMLVLALIFGVLRPVMKRLTAPVPQVALASNEGGGGSEAEGGEVQRGLTGEDQMRLPGPGRYENTLNAAREMVTEDPKRVAQVVKSWVAESAG